MKSTRYLELLMDLFCSSGTTRMIVTFLGTFMTVSSNIISPPPAFRKTSQLLYETSSMDYVFIYTFIYKYIDMYDQENMSYDYICYTMNTYRPTYHIFFSTNFSRHFHQVYESLQNARKNKTTTFVPRALVVSGKWSQDYP